MVQLNSQLSLHRLNDGLSVAVVGLAAYIFLLPLMPQFGWWLERSAPIISNNKPAASAPALQPSPKDNRVIIPSLDLNEPLLIGDDVTTVDRGVWLRPNASTPDQGSNTVLVGHRFTYTNPRGEFYFLDKISLNDLITVHWEKQVYTYKVAQVKIVDATATAIELPTSRNQLTLYTCTPLWSLKDRLVVVAREVQS